MLAKIVATIVRGVMDKKSAASFIQQRAAEEVQQADQSRFIEIVETEIMGLHEGNIVRFHLRPTEYRIWRESWR
jgi:hypothetical protein